MIKLETGTFFDTLLNIFEESPSSILFIILGIIFTLAMIINIKKNKKIGKTLYIIGWIFIISFIVIRYNSYLSKIFDNLILSKSRNLRYFNNYNKHYLLNQYKSQKY